MEKVFAAILADPRVRFFGGVEVGQAVTVEELSGRYTALIFTHGAIRSKPPGLPGETLPGVLGAAEFVAWYNGHPDFQGLAPDLSHETAVVVGNGNVAMDVTRILVTDPDELAKTDIADHALAALRESVDAAIEVLHAPDIGRLRPEGIAPVVVFGLYDALTASDRPLASVIVPVFVKLGAVPVCVTVRSAVPVVVIVPLFRCAALARASVRS